jgi:hypothetical protein
MRCCATRQRALSSRRREAARRADDLRLGLPTPPGSLDEAMHIALAVAAGDVLLEELLAVGRWEGIAEILLQAAVSNLPLTPETLLAWLAFAPFSISCR